MIMVFDRKQDFFDLASEYNFPYFLHEDFCDNWFLAPHGVNIDLWHNFITEILTTYFELRVGSQGILLEILKQLPFSKPSLQQLNNTLTMLDRTTHKETSLRLKHRLSWLDSIISSIVFSVKTPDWAQLIQSGCILSLAGLPTQIQTLCITIYFAKVLLYRICNNLRSDNLETLFVLDEASIIFPKSTTKKISLLLDYFQQARAFGIGVIFASQSMNLASEIYANTAIKICVGGFGHGSDYAEFSSAVGLTHEQAAHIRKVNQVGDAVIKDIRYPTPFTVQIDKPTKTRNYTINEIRALSKQSQITFYGDHKECSTSVIDTAKSDIIPAPAINKRLENALNILRAQINHKHIFLFRQEVAFKAGIKGGATLAQAENEALKHDIIKKNSLPKAKTEVCLWEITEQGYQLIQKDPAQWKSKGGYLHKFCAYRIAEYYEQKGYKVKIEYNLSNGKLVDLCLIKDDEILFIEICSSYPLEKEISNLHKNISGDITPDKIIFAVTERKMKKELEKLILQESNLPCIVEVILAGNLIETEKQS